MNDDNNEYVCQWNNLVNLCHLASVEASKGNFAAITYLAQSRITPLLQTAAHDAWLKHHQSGVGKA